MNRQRGCEETGAWLLFSLSQGGGGSTTPSPAGASHGRRNALSAAWCPAPAENVPHGRPQRHEQQVVDDVLVGAQSS